MRGRRPRPVRDAANHGVQWWVRRFGLRRDIQALGIQLRPRWQHRLIEEYWADEGYEVGLPILIEEIFPINIGMEEYRSVLGRSRDLADGWLSFYWSEPPEQLTERDAALAGLVREATTAFEELRR